MNARAGGVGAKDVPSWVPIAGFAVGVLTLLFFMGLVGASLTGHEIPCNSRFLVVVILAFSGALALGLWGGSIAAKGSIPLPMVQEHPIAFAAGGGIAALIVLLALGNQLYSSRDCQKDTDLDQKISAMHTNVQNGQYEAALDKAEEILKADPKNFRALNSKGSIAFYRRQFDDAARYFAQALQVKPDDRIIASNLADAYVETGAYQLALDLYTKINNGSTEWQYAIGRAYLFAGRYDESIKHLEAAKDSPQRSANVLLAAAYVGKATAGDDQGLFLKAARTQLDSACVQGPSYWNEVLAGGKKVKQETYEKVFPLLGKIYVNSKPCV
jgi:tetratricopeptide (TPR) repeat protein